MADNLSVIDGTGASKQIKTTDNTGVHTPHHIVDSSALPTGAATAAKQPALGTAGAAAADVISIQGVASMTAVKVDGSGATQPVSGTVTANAGSGTQAVSAASLPLPAGAATLAKQPALGTAGAASADVITIQGVASMTAVKVDGSGATQPVSGSVTANLGTTGGVALDATLTGGTQKAIARGATKGSTSAADVTVTSIDANHNGIDVNIVAGGGSGGTSSSFGAAIPSVGTALGFSDGTLMQIPSDANPLPVRQAHLTAANDTATVNYGSGTFPVSAASLPLPTGASTEATLAGVLTTSDFDTKVGSLTESAPGTDTASSGLNGRLQRIAQRISSLIALVPTALSNGFFQVSVKETITLPASQSGTWTVQPGNTANTTAWKTDGSAVTQPISASSLPLPSNAAATADVQAVRDRLPDLTLGVSGYTTSDITDTVATHQIIAGIAAKHLYITHILVTNSHATVGTRVDLLDGSGGTAIYGGYAAALGGGFSATIPAPGLKVPTTANGLYAQCGTTSSAIRISCIGYSGA